MNSIRQIEVKYDSRQVGHLAMTKDGLCAFEYSAEWLSSGFSISPFELPLQSGVFIAKPRPFEGGFGVFDDCLPDGWGRLILSRYLFSQGIHVEQLDLLQQLCLVGTKGRGALDLKSQERSKLTNHKLLYLNPFPNSPLLNCCITAFNNNSY